jgi:hypothetical protein
MLSFRPGFSFLPAGANRYLGVLTLAGSGWPYSRRGVAPKTAVPPESGLLSATAPPAPASRTRCVFVFPMF